MTESFNRYTYAMNNPMVNTDPNGQLWNFVVGGIIGGFSGYKIGKASGAHGWGLLGFTLGGAALGAFTAGVGEGAIASFGVAGSGVTSASIGAYAAAGAITGAVSGASFAALAGGGAGSIGKAALWGGAIGGATGALGGYLKHAQFENSISNSDRYLADCPKCAAMFPGATGNWLDEATVVGQRSSNTMSVAVSFALTAASVDGPLPYGDLIGVAAIAGAATYVYGGDLTRKMVAEIEGIKQRINGPQGVQYSLRASQSGTYPCYTCPGGTTNLSAGDVWKYGETTNPAGRYSQSFLQSRNLEQINEFAGNRMQIKIVEKLKIYGYFFRNQHLPAGNKIFR